VFSRLPESNAKRQRRLGSAMVSTMLHFVFIALAVRATTVRATLSPKVQPVDAIYLDPRPAEPARPTEPRTTSSTSTATPSEPSVPEAPNVVIDVNVSGIPLPGPVIDLTRRGDFDPTANMVSSGGTGGTPNVANGSPLPEDLVDKPILAIPGTATPRYPSMLQTAGVEGDVRAQFVVDTLGRVEQGTVRVLDTSHDLFASAVRDALNRARFKPAEAGGRKVRQLAEQVFTFRIDR
jgi:periplasmic protein TonB